jgi:hypothetical protein
MTNGHEPNDAEHDKLKPEGSSETCQHTENSSYREKLIEHLFVAELLKLSWLHHGCTLEVAKPEVDNAGYDIIAEASGVVRHIQLKTSVIGGKTAKQKIHTKLVEKPVTFLYRFNGAALSNQYLLPGRGRPPGDLSSGASSECKGRPKNNSSTDQVVAHTSLLS